MTIIKIEGEIRVETTSGTVTIKADGTIHAPGFKITPEEGLSPAPEPTTFRVGDAVKVTGPGCYYRGEFGRVIETGLPSRRVRVRLENHGDIVYETGDLLRIEDGK